MGDMVIVAYRAKSGKEDQLLALTSEHVPDLRRPGFAGERATLAMRWKGGDHRRSIEWRDGAIDAAHTSPDVVTDRLEALPYREHAVDNVRGA